MPSADAEEYRRIRELISTGPWWLEDAGRTP
jgi:hypothetical protein